MVNGMVQNTDRITAKIYRLFALFYIQLSRCDHYMYVYRYHSA